MTRYQSGVLVIGYSYGYFGATDMLRLGLVMSAVDSLLVLVIVPLYWPLIGIRSWGCCKTAGCRRALFERPFQPRLEACYSLLPPSSEYASFTLFLRRFASAGA